MWAHPYLQAVNLVHATKQDPHTWTHDGDMSEAFGLEPNFGCCVRTFVLYPVCAFCRRFTLSVPAAVAAASHCASVDRNV